MSADLEAAKDRARLAFREARHDLWHAERRGVGVEEARLAVKVAGDEFVRAWRAWHD